MKLKWILEKEGIAIHKNTIQKIIKKEGLARKYRARKLKYKDGFLKLVPSEKIQGGKFPAAWLIESCGLKGNQIGGAKISEEHCNFIVNADVGRATSDEVLEVIKLCKQKVREKFNIDLKEELVIV